MHTTYLPSRSRENVLVALVPTPFHDLPCMGFVLLDIGIRQETDVVMDVKVE